MAGRARTRFGLMTRDQLIQYCRELYETRGPESLTYKSISSEKGLYENLYRQDITQRELLRILGIEEVFKDHFKTWSWQRILAGAKEVTEQNGFLPPAQWFRDNGRGDLVSGLFSLGRTWADLRSECNSFQGSTFVESRNGIRWLSHAEASLSNFLYARGITHKRGRKYAPEYTQVTGLSYAYYDLAFLGMNDEWIDVEVWGEKPHGHQEKWYAKKRAIKERFNTINPNFLGIEFRDCYSEQRLTAILEPYIGLIVPYVFGKPTDRTIPSTHWSNTDELLEYCHEFAGQQPGGRFPTEEWLRKRGKWKNRAGPAYNTLAVYIKLWVGGVRKLREILGQSENSTIEWDRESALSAYREWYKSYGRSPSSMRKAHQRGQIQMTDAESKRAANIAHAVDKYVGNTEEVHKILGLPAPRRSPTKHQR